MRAWIGRFAGIVGLCLSGTMLTAQWGDVMNMVPSVITKLAQYFVHLFGWNVYHADNAYWSAAIKALAPLILHIAFGMLLLHRRDKNTGAPFVEDRKVVLILAACTWVLGFYATDWLASGPAGVFFSRGSGTTMAIMLAIAALI
ncbi:hypothetical protein [Ktedonobacter sp. SOSP1-85]|uniref:hypothetical protein n=1 Tax=Ktedonobacter sp. SOSP1-85 TaxID=2778367 RepID=UPI001915133D|nr:hypothetical protein [Ktedonobacter sp. SOSP1-85]